MNCCATTGATGIGRLVVWRIGRLVVWSFGCLGRIVQAILSGGRKSVADLGQQRKRALLLLTKSDFI